MAFRSCRARSSAMTSCRSRSRSSVPSAARTAGPNRSVIAARVSPPGRWTSRTKRSASITVAPHSANHRTTVDLPAATLPVRATLSTESGAPPPPRGVATGS